MLSEKHLDVCLEVYVESERTVLMYLELCITFHTCWQSLKSRGVRLTQVSQPKIEDIYRRNPQSIVACPHVPQEFLLLIV